MRLRQDESGSAVVVCGGAKGCSGVAILAVVGDTADKVRATYRDLSKVVMS